MASTTAYGARAHFAVLPSVSRRAWQAARRGRLRCRPSSPAVRNLSASGPASGFRQRTIAPAQRGVVGRRHVEHLVDDSGRLRVVRGDGFAVGAHRQRDVRAAEPRQPLRAARAGNDAEQHLGLADLASLCRDAEVARHRDLESAAERVAVNGGDERLGRVLDPLQQACVLADRANESVPRSSMARKP